MELTVKIASDHCRFNPFVKSLIFMTSSLCKAQWGSFAHLFSRCRFLFIFICSSMSDQICLGSTKRVKRTLAHIYVAETPAVPTCAPVIQRRGRRGTVWTDNSR